jgi:hypothetical protein
MMYEMPLALYIDFKFKGKNVPVLNNTPCHEDVLGSGDISPRVLDVGTKWR